MCHRQQSCVHLGTKALLAFAAAATVWASHSEAVAQTVIATSACSTATACAQQRKIARGPGGSLSVYYQDTGVGGAPRVMVVNRDSAGSWGQPEGLCPGSSPTVAISAGGRQYLVCVTNDALPMVEYRDLSLQQVAPLLLSDGARAASAPVADVDSCGAVHVVWIERSGADGASLKYACVTGAQPVVRTLSGASERVTQGVVANHLRYLNDDIYVAYAHLDSAGDSYITIKLSPDHGATWLLVDTLVSMPPGPRLHLPVRGTCPALAVGFPDSSDLPYASVSAPTLLYLDALDQVHLLAIEDLYPSEWGQPARYGLVLDTSVLFAGRARTVLIDNPVYNLGFSYVFLTDDKLIHAYYRFPPVGGQSFKDTVSGSPMHPTMTYKHFNANYIDVVWTRPAAQGYELVYQRMAKGLTAAAGQAAPAGRRAASAGRPLCVALVGGTRYTDLGGGLRVHDLMGRCLMLPIAHTSGAHASGVYVVMSPRVRP